MSVKGLIILAILFAVISSPMTFRLTREVFGAWVASPSGCASESGVILHAVVFAAALGVLWKLQNRSEGFENLSVDRERLYERFINRQKSMIKQGRAKHTHLDFKGAPNTPLAAAVGRRLEMWYTSKGKDSAALFPMKSIDVYVEENNAVAGRLGGWRYIIARLNNGGEALLFVAVDPQNMAKTMLVPVAMSAVPTFSV